MIYLFDGDVTGLREKPSYAGTFVYRIAPSVPAEPQAPEQAGQQPQQPAGRQAPAGAGARRSPAGDAVPTPRIISRRVELKGELNATPDHAELPAFELTIHAKATRR